MIKLNRKDKQSIRLDSWAKIKCALEENGHSLASVARKLKISRQAVAKVKNRPSAPVQEAIASALNTDPENIWPERYARAA